MGATTDIEWADSTVNPTTGCDGCELWTKGRGGSCYAGNLHERRLAKSLPTLYAQNFTDVRLVPGRMAKAARWSDLTGITRPDKPWLDCLPRMIFVGDMGDIFSHDIPFDYLKAEVIDVAMSPNGRRHVWMLLTKQANRAVEFSHWLADECSTPWPENIWGGVSVTNSTTEPRAAAFCYHRAATKFLSVEPLLGPISFSRSVMLNYRLAIVGGESGHGARPMDPDWVRSIRDQCQAAQIPFFFKQWGEYLHVHPSELHLSRAPVIEPFPNLQLQRVGKKAAGRMLDGRMWDEFPEPKPSPNGQPQQKAANK